MRVMKFGNLYYDELEPGVHYVRKEQLREHLPAYRTIVRVKGQPLDAPNSELSPGQIISRDAGLSRTVRFVADRLKQLFIGDKLHLFSGGGEEEIETFVLDHNGRLVNRDLVPVLPIEIDGEVKLLEKNQ